MKYYEKIDGLRFIAISAVLVHHMASIFSTYIDWGYFGVDLFFVISGFLITSILLKPTGTFKKNFTNFIVRRALRIFPLYYFVLFVLVIAGHAVVRENIISLLTYTFNYKVAHIDIHNPVEHFWSLCVEEQFYLFWPFLILSLRKRLELLTLVIFLIVAFAYCQIHFNILPSIQIYNYTGLPSRMGSLGLGGLGAILFLKPTKISNIILNSSKIEFIIWPVLVLALIYRIPILLGVCSLFFVLKAASDSFHSKFLNRLLIHKKVLFIAKISYGLYIYHVPIIYYATPHLFDPIWHRIDFDALGSLSVLQYHSWLVKFPLYSALTIVISKLSYDYFERPILKLKKHF